MNTSLRWGFLEPALIALVLAGCSGAGVPSHGTFPAGTTAGAGSVRASWVAPEARGKDLLYVAEYGHSQIQIYTYPEQRLVGTLTGVYYPQGECTDASGDVFVANSAANYVSEFRHGETTAVATYVDSPRHPYACSIDPTTGDLAVTEYGEGNVRNSIAIFHSPRTPFPKEYQNAVEVPTYCTYDPRGNLFVEGYVDQRTKLVELPKDSHKFKTIKLDTKFAVAGNVQWDGSYIAVANSRKTINRFVIDGTTGHSVGTTTLEGLHHDLRLFSFYKNVLIVPNIKDVDSIFGKGNLEFYAYPAGGLPTKAIPKLEGPDDAVVSPRAK